MSHLGKTHHSVYLFSGSGLLLTLWAVAMRGVGSLGWRPGFRPCCGGSGKFSAEASVPPLVRFDTDFRKLHGVFRDLFYGSLLTHSRLSLYSLQARSFSSFLLWPLSSFLSFLGFKLILNRRASAPPPCFQDALMKLLHIWIMSSAAVLATSTWDPTWSGWRKPTS